MFSSASCSQRWHFSPRLCEESMVRSAKELASQCRRCKRGNSNPRQYSCLENPWTEEPGGLQSTGTLTQAHEIINKLVTAIGSKSSEGAAGPSSSLPIWGQKPRVISNLFFGQPLQRGSALVLPSPPGHFSSTPPAQTVKHLPVMQEMQIQSLGWEDPLEEGMATHSSILA